MGQSLAPVHDALDELRALVDQTEDQAERQGLAAFIECVSPHLVENATMTFLGKIASIVQASGAQVPTATNSAEALEALKEHFDVVVE